MSLNVTYIRFLLALPIIFSVNSSWANSLEQSIDELLTAADQLLAQNKLTTPAERNAYDRYQAVLILDPDNPQALAGIQAIAKQYLSFARSHLARGNHGAAKSRLQEAIRIGGNSPAAQEVVREIAQSHYRRPAKKVALKPPSEEDYLLEEIFLHSGHLSARNGKIKNRLRSLGQRVQETKEYVAIYARDDSEGRWIYQQLKKGSPNHRVQGNILRSKEPRLVFEPPLD